GSRGEGVDAGLVTRDRGLALGPGETNFKLRKRHAIDDDRLLVRTSDPGVPEASASLEGLDLKAVVIHVVSLSDFENSTKPRARKNDCELVHISRQLSPRYFTAELCRARPTDDLAPE